MVPFLGAGASLLADVPKIWTEAALGPPTGKQLAQLLADNGSYPELEDRSDLARVASFYTESVDRTALLGKLCEVFNRDYRPRPVHEFLAQIERPLLIVTTNYDDLLEQAFRKKNRPFHLVVHPTDRADLQGSVLWWKPGEDEPTYQPPAMLPLSAGKETIIYKMHGGVDRRKGEWHSFVITEEDYVEFLSRMSTQSAIPATFLLHFRRSRFLFLGYGLGDWNLRVMLKTLREPPGRPTQAPTTPQVVVAGRVPGLTPAALRSWAIQHEPSELEEKLWASRMVNIYDIALDTFVDRLKQHGRTQTP